MDISTKPEKIKQRTVAPLNVDGEIRPEKAVCQFDYYLNESGGKRQPRLYLCEHRTLADIFLEAALFDPKKNVLCISKAEWESSPEEVKKVLRKFEKLFREPYQASQSFIRQLFGARGNGKSILLPAAEDARGMDRDPFLDERALVRLCRELGMPVCTVTFRTEPNMETRGDRNRFFLDVKPLFAPETLRSMSPKEAEDAVSGIFPEKGNTPKSEAFRERKRRMMRAFLKSELNTAIPVEICQCHTMEAADETKKTGESIFGKNHDPGCDMAADHYSARSVRTPGYVEQNQSKPAYAIHHGSGGVLRVDMSGITLETADTSCHRGPGALKSLAIYPGKLPETGERGTFLIYPYFDKVFYLFTVQGEEAENIQASVEQMYEIVSGQ